MSDELETTDAPEVAAGADADPAASAEAEDTPAPTPAPAIDWNTLPPEAEARIAQMADERLAATFAQYAPQPQPEAVELDPLSDNFGDQLVTAIGRVLDNRLGGIEGFVQSQASQQIDQQISQQVQTAVADAKLANAPDDSVISKLAENFTGETVQRYGRTPAAAQAAIRQAVDWLASDRKQAADAAVNAYKVSIGQIADTPAEPSATGGAMQIETKPSSYDEIIARHEARFATVA